MIGFPSHTTIATPGRCFRVMTFHVTHGYVEVPTSDYSLIYTNLDKGHPWLTCSIVHSRYTFTYNERFSKAGNKTKEVVNPQTRSSVVTATRMKPSVLSVVLTFGHYFAPLEKLIKQLLHRYPVENSESDFVMKARSDMMSTIGKLALDTASKVDNEAKSNGKTASPCRVQRIVEESFRDQFGEIEDGYRTLLAKSGTVIEVDPIHPKKQPAAGRPQGNRDQQQNAPSEQPADNEFLEELRSRFHNGADDQTVDVKLTRAMVLKRLLIETLEVPAQVKLINHSFLNEDLHSTCTYVCIRQMLIKYVRT